MLFRTKICGVTTIRDIESISDSGVDALGLNFYQRSKRYVAPEVASRLANHIPSHIARVGVFVNASSAEVREIAHSVQLDYVQLHGDEPPEILGELTELQVIRAFRSKGALDPLREYLQRCPQPPVAVLVDAYDPGEYGGTGKTLKWPELASPSEYIGNLPLILAGGLTPQNVALAISQARPQAVDTASGVEPRGGIAKDATLSAAFVTAANTAFSAESE